MGPRAGFDRLIRTDPATLTDLERAARFIYLQRLAFGGRVDKRTFGIVPSGNARFDMSKLVPLLEAVYERLAGVTIEALPWSDFVRRYDRAGTLFYLDPPYWGNEGDYGPGLFGRDQFAAMAEQLRGIDRRFILSINDRPEVRVLFAGFTIDAVEARYSVGGMATSRMHGELIISN